MSHQSNGEILRPAETRHVILRPLNEFDLDNFNIYDYSGLLIEEAENPKDYDLLFSNRLTSIRLFIEFDDFLNYQFQQPPTNLFSWSTWNFISWRQTPQVKEHNS